MHRPSCRHCGWWVLAASLAAPLSSATAQELSGGFEARATSAATGEELSRQTGLWILEVSLKPMRLIQVEITDPKTGKKSSEQVWYLCYKAINRPLVKKEDTEDVTPMNDFDAPPGKPVFVPEFTLVVDDNDEQRVYHDAILPEAQAAILKRESRRPGVPKYRNSVEVVGALPDAVEGEPGPGQALWGVAMFRGIDPTTDNFTLYMTGFSNAYKVIDGPDGEPLVLRRTLRQEFWRPGDEFSLKEVEFRLKGEASWEYRPDDVTAKVEEPAEPKAAGAAPAAENN